MESLGLIFQPPTASKAQCSARIENLKQVCYNGKWRTVAELALKDRRQLLVVMHKDWRPTK